MGYQSNLVCQKCGQSFETTSVLYNCKKCGGYLKVIYDYPMSIKSQVEEDSNAKASLSILKRWKSVLPISQPELIDRVTLGETETPLLRLKWLENHLNVARAYVKCEYLFPTASLKDRSMPLVVLKALEYGKTSVSIVSSGNAAASLSAYAAKAGLQAVIFVRGGASPSKLVKASICGAVIVRVNGHMSQINDLFLKMRDRFGWYDCDGGVNPYRCEGKKTCAYEIASQLNWEVPDWVIIPTSTGNGLVAAGIGFDELYKMRLISKKPRLSAIQLEACTPIYDAFKKGQSTITPVIPSKSVSDTLLNGNPDAGGDVLYWVRENSGTVAAVSDQEVVNAVKMLAEKAGIFQEAAGAVSVAGAKKMRESGIIGERDSVVCVLTGSGLNQQDLGIEISKTPALLEPEENLIREYILSQGKNNTN